MLVYQRVGDEIHATSFWRINLWWWIAKIFMYIVEIWGTWPLTNVELNISSCIRLQQMVSTTFLKHTWTTTICVCCFQIKEHISFFFFFWILIMCINYQLLTLHLCHQGNPQFLRKTTAGCLGLFGASLRCNQNSIFGGEIVQLSQQPFDAAWERRQFWSFVQKIRFLQGLKQGSLNSTIKTAALDLGHFLMIFVYLWYLK